MKIVTCYGVIISKNKTKNVNKISTVLHNTT